MLVTSASFHLNFLNWSSLSNCQATYFVTCYGLRDPDDVYGCIGSSFILKYWCKMSSIWRQDLASSFWILEKNLFSYIFGFCLIFSLAFCPRLCFRMCRWKCLKKIRAPFWDLGPYSCQEMKVSQNENVLDSKILFFVKSLPNKEI